MSNLSSLAQGIHPCVLQKIGRVVVDYADVRSSMAATTVQAATVYDQAQGYKHLDTRTTSSHMLVRNTYLQLQYCIGSLLLLTKFCKPLLYVQRFKVFDRYRAEIADSQYTLQSSCRHAKAE